jgi:phage nucleotide-binding protein
MKIISTKNEHYEPSYICIYGAGGIGKTSLVKTLPMGEVLILDAESGLASLADVDIQAIPLSLADDGTMIKEEDRYEKVKEFVSFVQRADVKAKYKYIFIDSLTEIGQNVLKTMQAKFKGFEAWGNYTSSMMHLLKFFRDIGHYTVIFTALEGRIEDDAGAAYAYPDIGGKKAKEYLLPQFDEVFRMIADGEKKRWLITRSTAKTQAKDRSNKLQEMEAPDLGAIIRKMRAPVVGSATPATAVAEEKKA